MGLLDLLNEATPEERVQAAAIVTAAVSAGGDSLTEHLRTGWPEGQRNEGMTRLGGLLRSHGLGAGMIAGILTAVNKATDTGLPDNELAGIAKSVQRYTPSAECRVPAVAEILDVRQAGDAWRKLHESNEGARSGFKLLDLAIPHFAPGEVFTLAARSGVGKTTVGLELGRAYADSLRGRCLFVSLEMNAESVFFRMFTVCETESTGTAYDGGEIAARLRNEYDRAVHSTAARYGNVLIVDKDSLNLEQVEMYWRLAAERGAPVPVCVIDYLGYLSDAKGGDSYERVSRIARGVKGLAKRMQGRVILLCQTSRAGGDGTVEVKMQDLRDSGAVEESADHILGAWRDSVGTRLHCRVLKTRHAERGNAFDFIMNGLAMQEAPFELPKGKPF